MRILIDNLHKKSNSLLFIFILFFFFIASSLSDSLPQTEVMAWGNITGMRIEGELIPFETSIQIAKKGWQDFIATAKEKQRPHFTRDKETVSITSQLDEISLKINVMDTGPGKASVSVECTAQSQTEMEGAFFCLELSESDYANAAIDLINAQEKRSFDFPEDPNEWRNWWRSRYNPIKTNGVRIKTDDCSIEITTEEQTDVVVLKGNPFWGNPNTKILFAVVLGNAKEGQIAQKTFGFKVLGKIDNTPLELELDAQKPGRVFDGVGGNFRLQNPMNDPEVINYCLENLNVTWGRVPMPWRNWHSEEYIDPLAAARNGKINNYVHQSMLMAQRLAKKNTPVIVSAWSAPNWAIVGEISWRPRPDGLRGNPLNQSKIKSIIKSISSYIVYLKEAYGVEAAMFSFNESDLGINIRQTGEEHAELIKTLGAHFASLGLSTKILLGDNSDATTYSFTTPAVDDPETHKYIGAVSFHSWRGCDNWTLSIWRDISSTLNVPLLVCEGGTDAAAHNYPQIFLEPSYALNEIDMYLRILSICQAKSILQWQLTSDYSLMTGSGIYESEGKLKPTQRFWNLKQLGLTPKGSFHLPIKSSRTDVSCAAFGDIANGHYSIHLVNNGTGREVELSGIPAGVSEFHVYITDHDRGMEKGQRIKVTNGGAKFKIDAVSYTTLISE